MKNKIAKLLICFVALMACLVLASCGAPEETEVEKPTEVKIIFDANYRGGGFQEKTYAPSETRVPAEVSRTGYRFDGWYCDRDCTESMGDQLATAKNCTTYYAKWTALPQSLTATYNCTLFVGDTVEKANFDVAVTYPDGTSQTLDQTQFDVSAVSTNEAGTKTVTLSYTENQTTVTVTVDLEVLEIVISSLKVVASGKEIYFGDEFSKDMLVVTATYNNGHVEEISDYSQTGFDSRMKTQTTVTVFAGQASQQITLPVKPVLASVSATHTGPSVYVGDTIGKADFTVKAIYTDGSEKVLAEDQFMLGTFSSETAGDAYVDVSYTEGTQTKQIQAVVKVVAIQIVKLEAQPTQKKVYHGDEFSKDMLVVTATYNNGNVQEISNYSQQGFSSAPAPSTTFTVHAEEQQATVTIVLHVALTSLSATYGGASVPLGLTAARDDFDVVACYSDGTTKQVSDFTLRFEPTEIGPQPATISYQEDIFTKTCTANVTVIDAIVTELTATVAETPLRQICVGDQLADDMFMLQLVAQFSDGSQETATDFTVDGFDTSEAREITLVFSYCGTTATVTVQVKEVALAGISATHDGTVFIKGSTFRPTTMTVLALYNNGTSRRLVSAGGGEYQYTRSGFSTTEVGDVYGTVSYHGFSQKVYYKVVSGEITGISVQLCEDCTLYDGDELNKNQFVVTLHYSEGMTAQTKDFKLPETFDKDLVGSQTLTFSYPEDSPTHTAQLQVDVVRRTVVEVKAVYSNIVAVGENLDDGFLTVNVTYSNGKTVTVENFSKGTLDSATAGAKYVEISYSWDDVATSYMLPITVIDTDKAYSHNLSIHFLEVGNGNAGDSVYIKIDDVDILIDAGSRASSAETIAAYVDRFCLDGKLEYVIATHAHEDHISGFVGTNNVRGIYERYLCDTIIDFSNTNQSLTALDSEGNERDTLYGRYVKARQTAIDRGANHYSALDCVNNANGAQKIFELTSDGSVTLEILYQRFYDNKTSNENNYSVCVLLKQGENNFLFTGDLEDSGEASLIDENPNLPHVKMYKGGHHGSYTAASEALMHKITPENVCICCCAGSVEYTQDQNNTFPAQDFINRVAPYTENVYVTTLGITHFDQSKQKWVNDGYQSMNGNITLSVDVYGAVSIVGSNNNTKLKDTQWFATHRTTPLAWQNGTSIYK